MKLSIVIPAYNEEDTIYPLYAALKGVVDNQGFIVDYQIIFVDDGSTDSTADRLKAIEDPKLEVVALSKNTGNTNAFLLGFKKAKHNIIVTMDADLQNDPRDIPKMLEEIRKGYDCVVGWRFQRKDRISRILSSKIANAVRRLVLNDNFHDIGCGLRVFTRECVKGIETFEGALRFFPYLVQMRGFKVTECKVRHHPRKFGKSKYNIRNRIFTVSRDLIHVKRIAKRKRAS